MTGRVTTPQHRLAATFSSQTVEWYSPRDLVARLNAIFDFTLDPCATQDNAVCARYYTKEDDGLSKSWDGERAFLNPPYGRDIGRWMRKAAESEALVVCLVPVRPATAWWHDWVLNQQAHVIYLRGCLKFGGVSTSAPFPSALVIYAGSAFSPVVGRVSDQPRAPSGYDP